jgi:hypothetical protein
MALSQKVMPPPRSEVQVHQPLRGVITTSGASAESRPVMVVSTLEAWVWRSVS